MDLYSHIERELENVNVYCFGLEQYDFDTYNIDLVVFANYKNEIYYADVSCDVRSFCEWDGQKWVPSRFLDVIKIRGIQIITDYIIKQKENEHK